MEDTRSLPKQFSGLTGRLCLLLCAVLIPILIIQAYMYWDRFRCDRDQELEANIEVARALSKAFTTFVTNVLNQELSIGLAATASPPLSARDFDRFLKKSAEGNASVRDFSWVSPGGIVLASSNAHVVGMDVSGREHYKEIFAGREYYVSNLVRGPYAPVFFISRGIRNDQGDLLGIATAVVVPDELDSSLAIERPNDGGITLIDRNGLVVYRYPHRQELREGQNWIESMPVFRDVLNGKELAAITSPLSGEKAWIGAATPVSSIGWIASAGGTENDALRPVMSALLRDVELFALVMFFSLFLALFVSRTISLPIKRLQQHALGLASGESNGVIKITGPTELKDLAVAYNRMTENLIRSKAELQAIFNSISDAIIITDKEHCVIAINPAVEKLFGFTFDDFQGQPTGFLYFDKADFEKNRPWASHDGTLSNRRTFDVLYRRKNLTVFPAEFLGNPVLDSQGNHIGFVEIYRDVTPRKKMEAELLKSKEELELRVRERTIELQEANEHLLSEIAERVKLVDALRETEKQLRLVPSKLLEAQEEERKRVAGELHDTIGQTFAALKFWVEAIIHSKETRNLEELMKRLQMFVPILQRSIEEIRGIYMGLRPAMLDGMGVIATLRWFCREFMELYPKHHIEFHLDLEESDVPEALKVVIFRIAQESLNNVAKHSGAEWVDLSLSKGDNTIELVVADDGVGVDLNYILPLLNCKGSLGLTSMRERAELTGGTFSFESSPGKGSTVHASWSVAADAKIRNENFYPRAAAACA